MKIKKYFAHIVQDNCSRKEQTVEEHCRKTAQYAEKRLVSVGFGKCGYLAGLLHDMGKYSDAFADYLEACYRKEGGKKGSVNHSFAGVIYLLERYHKNENQVLEKLTCELLSFAMGSHHGEFDIINLDSQSGFDHRLEIDRDALSYSEVKERYFAYCASEEEIDTLFHEATKEVTVFYNTARTFTGQKQFVKEKFYFYIGILARLILSAVIHADRSDTAEFMTGIGILDNTVKREVWKDQRIFLEEKIKQFKKDTPLNKMRSEISDRCAVFAKRGNGIYKICVPTGAGKTLATLRYALSLAEQTGKERILFVIPLLSVIDQNSQVIHEYIKDQQLILEHHSNILSNSQNESLDAYELLTQTWDAPIIITTLFQLLMSLFSSQTTAIRRMQALSNSVIILDEAQSLPYRSTYLFNLAVNFLNIFCNTTILLCSATQPCFEKVKAEIQFSQNPDMVSLSEKEQVIFQRTQIINKITPEGMTKSELVSFALSVLEKVHSVLIIGNTKKTAKDLYQQLKLLNSNEDFELFHLSTSMCTKHRLDTLNLIRDCLSAGRKMICVSTQLVEAGIDFSFESVIRIYAGMDNIAQAAGRCNRSFEYGDLCNVYLVSYQEENLSHLKEIKTAQSSTQNLLYAFSKKPEQFHYDLLSSQSLNFYYEGLFKQLERENTLSYPVKINSCEESLFHLLSDNSKYAKGRDYTGKYYLKQAFKTAGMLYSVFDHQTTDVIVPYNEEAKELIIGLSSKRASYDLIYVKDCLKKARQYSVKIWDYQKDQLITDGFMYSGGDGHFFMLQPQCYNKETGLDIENNMF